MDIDQVYGEKAWWQWLKNAMSYVYEAQSAGTVEYTDCISEEG